MKNKKLLLLSISAVIFFLISCKRESTDPNSYDLNEENKTSNIYDPNNYLLGGSYHSKYGILNRSMEEYDIVPIADLKMSVSPNQFIEAGYNFEFFNYNGEIQINNKILPNKFASNISSSIRLMVVDYESVLNPSLSISQEFGQWGTATVIIDNPRQVLNNVIITPLATKYLLERSINDRGALIFVRFEQNNGKEYKDYLFYGSTTSGHIVKNNYNQINTIPQMGTSSGTNNWKSIQ